MRVYIKLIIVFILCSLISCKKYLEKQPDNRLAVPRSLDDFQKLMDGTDIIESNIPQIGDFGSDDYYFLFEDYESSPPLLRNCYTWSSQIWSTSDGFDWSTPYSVIYYCNVVLNGLNDFQANNNDQTIKNEIYGHALFVRAYMHYFLEETFGQPYKPATANSDMGIPLKLTSNLAEAPVRASVQEVYDQLISDLEQAITLLPNTSSARSRPIKATAFALLARVYLTTQNYTNAKAVSGKCLEITNDPFDFNMITIQEQSTSNPFSSFSPPNNVKDVLYPSTAITYGVFSAFNPTPNIDSTLYNSYTDDDLRKTIYFQKNDFTNTFYVKADYTASSVDRFAGLTVAEVYLTRAECFARIGDKDSALRDLNTLLRNRWKTGMFTDIVATDAEDALRKILIERRKELVLRCLRWIDLRRLNQDPRFAITLTRSLDGQIYSLPPNDKKYTYPIPDAEIRMTDMLQNPR